MSERSTLDLVQGFCREVVKGEREVVVVKDREDLLGSSSFCPRMYGIKTFTN